MEVPQKIENRTAIWSSNPTTGYVSKETDIGIKKDTWTPCLLQLHSQYPRQGTNLNVYQQMNR
jgi:hypothetical protein